MLNLKTTLNFSEKLAIKLGKYILDNRSRIKVVEQKDLVDICTNIDKEVEQIAIDAISIKFPGHNIISEEIGEISRNSDYTWYLDPIDGTKEFLRDIPAYNTTFSLEYKNEIILGVTYQPFSKALFSGAINTGAFKNKQIIKVNQQDKLNESFVYAYLPPNNLPKDLFNTAWASFGRIAVESYRLRGQSDCVMSLNWVACGSAEAYVNLYSDYKINWFDVAAGLLMVEMAGGKVTDIYGKSIVNRDLSKGIVASNGKIHEQLLEVINRSV